MTKRTRRNHSRAFKAEVALAAIKGERTLAQLSGDAADIFGSGGGAAPQAPAVDVKSPHAKACPREACPREGGGRGSGWPWRTIPDRAGDKLFRGSAQQGGIAERKAKIGRDRALSVTKQSEAAGIARGAVYDLPRPVPAADLFLMREIDKPHTEFPFAGSRMLRGLLACNGSKSCRPHMKTLMNRMGIEALYRRPRTTKPEPGHKTTRIRCVDWRSRGRTRRGRWTSPISRWRRASSISPPCSTGSRGGCCRGACRSLWRRRSAWRH